MTTKDSTSTTTEGQQPADDAAAAEGTAAATEAQQAAEGTEATEEGKGGNKAGQEAAKYRKQLRDTEAERDALTGTVESLRRQIIAQNMPRANKMTAEALWTAGHQAGEFFTEAGDLDAAKLEASTRAVHERFGVPFRNVDPVPGSGQRDPDGINWDGPSWGDAIKKGRS
jgi:hypothetical protein